VSLKDWSEFGWVKPHTPRPREIADLLASADRNLGDSQVPGLSIDGRYGFAYQGILQAAAAALAASGYRAERDQHHHRILKSLRFTVGLDGDTVDRLDKYRKKRNQGVYEAVGVVSEQEVSEIVRVAKDLRVRIEDWLKDKHPDLMPE